ncbi:MAG: hypothetical protein HC857_09740 [Synechococcales cyanobacterium RU_4_20]|nr:hypothetical protein [Synechococcales cyanobacterium RU_4_20]
MPVHATTDASRTAPRPEQLRIASYNIHSCVGLDRRCRPARIATVLRELDCHVIALQEVDNVPGDLVDSMQLDYLAQTLEMASVAGLRIVRHTGEYGNALLSKLPITSVRRHDLSFSRYEPRGALDVTLELEGRELRVIATHLGLNRAERCFQWEQLRALIESAELFLGPQAEISAVQFEQFLCQRQQQPCLTLFTVTLQAKVAPRWLQACDRLLHFPLPDALPERGCGNKPFPRG